MEKLASIEYQGGEYTAFKVKQGHVEVYDVDGRLLIDYSPFYIEFINDVVLIMLVKAHMRGYSEGNASGRAEAKMEIRKVLGL